MRITDTFKVGCVHSEEPSFMEGKVYDVNVFDNGVLHQITDDDGDVWDYPLEFVKLVRIYDKVKHQTPLDKRKTGKLRLDLVDTGFPNALAALAEVMTWARESKGYLDDDWKNINEPFRALQGAASRHKNLRLQGIDFDEESGKLHLAHEAFNVLALLELKLTGKLEG